MLMGHLRSMGMNVKRNRVRAIIHQTDPLNAALRWSARISCRPYSVPGPNSLWHLSMSVGVILSV